MKPIFCLLLAFTTVPLFAQKKDLPSNNYSWNNAVMHVKSGTENRHIINGSTLDLSLLKVQSHMLKPGKNNGRFKTLNNEERLLIVKEGTLDITIGNTTTTLNPGGLALVVAGDKHRVKNTSSTPAIYYVLSYQSKDGVDIERGRKGGGSFVKDWKDYKLIVTDKGESRPIFDQPSSMFKRFDVHATALNPGYISHPAHTHRTEEIILMIKGTGEMQMGDVFHKASAGDVLFVNSKVPHMFNNTGKEQCGYFAIQWHSNAE